MFTEKHIRQINKKGVAVEDINRQLESFRKGFSSIVLDSPATVNNKGITKIDEKIITSLCNLFDDSLKSRSVVKFVPASGAASRMFKSLFFFREKYDGSEKEYQSFLSDTGINSVFKFITEIRKFAFYEDLKKVMNDAGFEIEICINKKDYNSIIDFLLLNKGLNYSALPKGLLKFHRYENISRTAFEEHFVEAANYAKTANNKALIHFTLSPEHIDKFKTIIQQALDIYEKCFNINYEISYSIQKPSTDTIAVDMNNEPFYELDGSLLFRPGGHGALIQNLNELNGDIIFIKNIDNIVVDRLKSETFKYKKVIGGLLIELQHKIWKYLEIIDNINASDDDIKDAIKFADEHLNIKFNFSDSISKEEKLKIIFSKLNRPIRICGMVKNEGEPGGGPFWTINSNGELSLQIVESSQIDLNDAKQKNIFDSSTHFNPVDLVCGVRDYKGNKFDLLKYTDPETGFISIKSKDGRELKALELPGLWNGAMSNWITIFIEVPIITFNPVKTVNDLLRVEHQ